MNEGKGRTYDSWSNQFRFPVAEEDRNELRHIRSVVFDLWRNGDGGGLRAARLRLSFLLEQRVKRERRRESVPLDLYGKMDAEKNEEGRKS